MAKADYVLAFVINEKKELFVHADEKGLSVLIAALERLKKKASEGICEHDHLSSKSWGSGNLSESKGSEKDGELIHHVKLYGWTEEWAKKHGFLE